MGGGRQWKKSFWKRIVKGIEEGFEIRSSGGDRGVEEEVSCLSLFFTLLGRRKTRG